MTGFDSGFNANCKQWGLYSIIITWLCEGPENSLAFFFSHYHPVACTGIRDKPIRDKSILFTLTPRNNDTQHHKRD